MRVLIVSRHKSTVELLTQMLSGKTESIRVTDHLSSIDEIQEDIVIGNLPIEMIEQVLAAGKRFVLVSLNVPRELRGQELDIEQLKQYMKLKEIKELKIEDFSI